MNRQGTLGLLGAHLGCCLNDAEREGERPAARAGRLEDQQRRFVRQVRSTVGLALGTNKGERTMAFKMTVEHEVTLEEAMTAANVKRRSVPQKSALTRRHPRGTTPP